MAAITYRDYDPVGRDLHRAQCISLYNCTYSSTPCSTATWWIVTNSYDLAGDLTSYTDAFCHTLTQTFDSAGRPSQLTSSWVDSTHPATLATIGSPGRASNGYAPGGQLKNLTLANGLTESLFYNNRLQPCRMNWNSSATTLTACSGNAPSGNLLDLTYGFVDSNGHNNGNLASWNAVGQQSFTRSFQYDSLNRVSQMQETLGNAESCKPASSSSSPYTLSWTYDAWGNRTNQSPSAGTCSFSQPVNPNNQFYFASCPNNLPNQSQYDAAGNMACDGVHQYFYDPENHLVQVDGGSLGSACSTTATACYLYNTDGERVYKYMSNGANTTSYIYGSDGQVASYTDTNYAWNLTYIHFGGGLFGLYAGTGTYFYQRDHLGSTRLGTDLNHNVTANYDYLPFGEQLTGGNETVIKFTGKERDSESGLDNFGARYNSSRMGRFMSPDSVSYSNRKNPQSWNLYAYALNNPVSFRDDDGHEIVCTNNAEQCKKDAAATTGNAEAAKRVTTQTTTEHHKFLFFKWDTTKTTIAITGDINSFRGLSSNASKLADLVTSKQTISVTYDQYAKPSFWANGISLNGGSTSYTPSQGYGAQAFIDPTRTPGVTYDQDAVDQGLPQANTGEEFGHEVLGHIWGEIIGGDLAGTRANMRDSIIGEDAVRALDPTRGQKGIESHHNYNEMPPDKPKPPQ